MWGWGVMSKLTAHQQLILKALLESSDQLSTSEVMKETNLAWQTCKKNLDDFFQKKVINRIKKGNREYWNAEPPKEADKK